MHNVEVVAEHSFPQAWKARLAWQGFWLAKPSTDAWYNAGAGVNHAARAGAANKVGDEVDVTLKHAVPSLSSTFYLGYSHFFPGAYITQTGLNKPADFAFAQVKSTF